MSHEVSDLQIIYDTPWGAGPEPRKVLITNRNVPGPDALGAVKPCKLSPRQKLINFAEYIAFP